MGNTSAFHKPRTPLHQLTMHNVATGGSWIDRASNLWKLRSKSVQPENDFVVKKSLRKIYFSQRKVDTLLKIEQFQNWCIFTIVRPFWLNFWFFKNFWSGFRKSVQPENDFVVKRSLRKTYFSKRKVDTLPKIEQFQNWCIFTIVTWEK